MKYKFIIGTLLVASATGIGIGLADDDDSFMKWSRNTWKEQRLDVAPVQHDDYSNECGDCHFLYQPGLLPARSWEAIMNTLDQHFGDNAELEPETMLNIKQYLINNAADKSNFKRSRQFSRTASDGEESKRITQSPYFKRQHDEVPMNIVRQKEIASLSQCDRCHTKAETGSFDENDIRIPGLGRWED